MKRNWMALAAASLVAACGGDDHNDATAPAPASASEAKTYTLTVVPHLGTLSPLAPTSMQPLANPARPVIATTTIDGRAEFKIPEADCGPGLVTLAGSAQTQYFDEYTGKTETLQPHQAVRALVADICSNTAPVSLSMLDEVMLHIPVGESQAFMVQLMALMAEHARNQARLNRAERDEQYRASLAAVQAAAALASEAAKKMLLAAQQQMIAVLGMPKLPVGTLPTPIGAPNVKLPATPEGQQAALIEAIARVQGELRQIAVDATANLLEAQAAQMGQEIARTHAAMAGGLSIDVSSGAIVLNSGLTGAGQSGVFQFGGQFGPTPVLAVPAVVLGMPGAALAGNLPPMVFQAADRMAQTAPEAATGFQNALQQLNAQAAQPNADLTLAMRAAFTPILLRAEPKARYDEAVAKGAATFACTANGVTRGTVAIAFVDADASGSLTADDSFTLTYADCLTTEPISRMALTRSGSMTVGYDPVSASDIRGHVTYDIRFHGGAANADLFRVSGAWVDRAAFGAPGQVAPAQIGSTSPTVMLDDVSLTLVQGGATYMTQIDTARLDMTGDFATGTSGQAELNVAGMIGGVAYGPGPMMFSRTPDFWPNAGAFRYERQQGGTGSGTIKVGTTKPYLVAQLTDGLGVTSERTLSWDQVVTAYLAR